MDGSALLPELLKTIKCLEDQLAVNNTQVSRLVTEVARLKDEVGELRSEVRGLVHHVTEAEPAAARSPPANPAPTNLNNCVKSPSKTCDIWHKSAEFCSLVRNFHDQNAKFPPREVMKPAKEYHTKLVEKIRDYLRKEINVINRVEYTGSSYENLRIACLPIEFDCLLVVRGGGSLVKEEEDMPVGFTKLKVTEDNVTHLRHLKDQQGLLSSDLAQRWFKGKMQNAVNDLIARKELKNGVVELHDHGPSIQMTIYSPDTGELWYYSDMVPVFEVAVGKTDYEMFVPKAYEGAETPGEVYTTWRQSFSLKEKEIMKNIDKGSTCRKMCLRTIKAIREQNSPLKKLDSYLLKTALLHVNKEPISWEEDKLGERFTDILRYLQGALEVGELPHYFLPGLNLVEHFPPIVCSNIETRIARLLESENQMTKTLQTN